MKIYIPIWDKNPWDAPNPYVATLCEGMKTLHGDCSFAFDEELIWLDKCESFDIIHIMWPHLFVSKMQQGQNLQARLLFLKSKGIKIVSTCHNYYTHVIHNDFDNLSYEIVYKLSDVIIHLGQSSFERFLNKYPNTHQIIIPHHVYDHLYQLMPDKNDALRKLSLKRNRKYILCLGAFRKNQEKEMVITLAQNLKGTKIHIIAPLLYNWPKGKRGWRSAIKKWLSLRMKCPNLHVKGHFIPKEDIPYYYAACDVSFIQRTSILNSGNVPMGLLFGNVVVGPDVGNVGIWLKQLGNPVFNPNDTKSITKAIKKGFELATLGYGKKNRIYALDQLNTDKISELHYICYMKLLS